VGKKNQCSDSAQRGPGVRVNRVSANMNYKSSKGMPKYGTSGENATSGNRNKR
jgi:hypothetical protein